MISIPCIHLYLGEVNHHCSFVVHAFWFDDVNQYNNKIYALRNKTHLKTNANITDLDISVSLCPYFKYAI